MTHAAVLYARVSSKDQEREGFSIPPSSICFGPTLPAVACVCSRNSLTSRPRSRPVAPPSAKWSPSPGSTGRLLLLVEKTDRLYRNLRDWVTLDELDLEIHLVKENVVLSPESRSHEKFMHGIKVLMAKNYVDNLSEETRKGMIEKAKQGIWPSYAPLGYRNVLGADGKRTIEPDPDAAAVIARMFERFARGDVSIKGLAREGLALRGRRLYPSLIHHILRKRIYSGDFDFDGTTYKGTHRAIVSREIWERVQAILDGRTSSKSRQSKRQFTLTGLVHCGHCGCLMVGELKKGRYVYYHCTGSKGKCGDPYVREERMLQEVSQQLKQLVVAPATLSGLERVIVESDQTEKGAREAR